MIDEPVDLSTNRKKENYQYYQDSNQNIIGAVYAGGMDMNDNTGAVRPAFNLDTSNVFMISAAEGGKNDDLGLASI